MQQNNHNLYVIFIVDKEPQSYPYFHSVSYYYSEMEARQSIIDHIQEYITEDEEKSEDECDDILLECEKLNIDELMKFFNDKFEDSRFMYEFCTHFTSKAEIKENNESRPQKTMAEMIAEQMNNDTSFKSVHQNRIV